MMGAHRSCSLFAMLMEVLSCVNLPIHPAPTEFMKCVINRRAKFSASHRYWLPELSEAENAAQFGPCMRFPGHGHNYILYVSMIGDVDENGMVLNLSDVKHVIKHEVTGQLDFSYLNEVWDDFQQTLPTTENLARVIWNRLAPYLPLVDIKLIENENLWAEYQGNAMEAYLTVNTHFSAAHRLAHVDLSFEENSAIFGKCARINGHGHNYHVDITVKGEIHPRTGMVVDLVALQETIDRLIIEPMDHSFLNKDIPYFERVVPTAENIAAYMVKTLQGPIAELGAQLYKVKLYESPNNACEVYASFLQDASVAAAKEPELAVV
jgi:6-pyruvoyltetrahydropterin/6-carboxytetrahydropterin synthase